MGKKLFRLRPEIDPNSIPIPVLEFFSNGEKNKHEKHFDRFERLNCYGDFVLNESIEVTITEHDLRYGEAKIRGFLKHIETGEVRVLVETDDFSLLHSNDFDGRNVVFIFEYFDKLSPRNHVFVKYEKCHNIEYHMTVLTSKAIEKSNCERNRFFEESESRSINEFRAMIVIKSPMDDRYLGFDKGIQGESNSCYIDSILYALFAHSATFDDMLKRESYADNSYEQARNILKSEIVYPLRATGFVAAKKTRRLRECLSQCLNDRSFVTAEKDPEEFINILLGKMFEYEEKLKLSSNQDTYTFTLFADKIHDWHMPDVQQLFVQSMLSNRLQLKEIPKYVILQMPRSGTSFKMYDYVFPTPTLDVSNFIENRVKRCSCDNETATIVCLECHSANNCAFQCERCYNRLHNDQSDHQVQILDAIENDCWNDKDESNSRNAVLNLLAVVCIETSHYVTFVKSSRDNNWVFFDSMAKQEDAVVARNHPYVEYLHDFLQPPNNQNFPRLLKTNAKLKRLCKDSYYCIYEQPSKRKHVCDTFEKYAQTASK